MRRDIGMVLAGLGTFLVVIAVALPTYITGQVLKFPLNYYYKATLVSPNTTYFSATKVAEVTGANVNAIYTLKGDATQGNSSTAVWDLFTFVYDTAYPGKTGEIQVQTRTVAFDRKTGELKNCCGANLNGQKVNESGVVGYVFPMGTQKKTYQVFDTTLLRPMPFNYVGTDTVDGILTYKFVENIPATKIGFSPLSGTEPLFYQNNVTYWVDPDTGALLKVNEHEQQFLENPITSARTTTLFDADLAPTAASVAAIVAIDNSGRLKITLIETILPIVLGVLGAIILVWGILLSRKRRDFTESGFDAMTKELAAAAPPEESTSVRQASGGKHAASSGIVPGMDGEREQRPATTETAEGENPDTAGGSSAN